MFVGVSNGQERESRLTPLAQAAKQAPPYRYVSMKVKLEYQPRLGWEEVTLGETARWWAQTFIRPDAHLLLARINPFESKLLQVEHRDMLALLPPTSLFKCVSQIARWECVVCVCECVRVCVRVCVCVCVCVCVSAQLTLGSGQGRH